MRYTVRPISDRTPFTGKHEPTPFRATWAATLDLLGSELAALDARDVVLEVDVTEGEVRLDGMLRANARVATPAVRIAFGSKHGPLTYATDRYESRWSNQPDSWQQNVRAIALSLEALRKVDRYGVTKRGEQYTGWKAIGAGPGTGIAVGGMTLDDALAVLRRLIVLGPVADPRLKGPDFWAPHFRRARAAAHPDRHGGDRALWDQVEQAAAVLGLA